MSITLVRLLSVLAVVWLQNSAGQRLVDAVFTIGMAHYVLSTFYARRNIAAAMSRAPSVIGLAGLIAAGVWLWNIGFQIIVAFLPHHVFNEVYMTKRELPSLQAAPNFILSAIVLNSLLYSQFVDLAQFCPIYIPSDLMRGATFVALIWFALNWLMLARAMSWKHLIDACSLEVAGVAILWLCGPGQITFFQLVLYHFAFWALQPLANYLKAKSVLPARNYICLNVAALAGAFLLSPSSILPYHFSSDAWSKLFYLLSFLHINTSFALSRAQPEWLCRFFLPAPQPVPNATTVQPEKVPAAAR